PHIAMAMAMTADKTPSLADGARAGAFARIGLIAALLAAAWAGGMGTARGCVHRQRLFVF
ncbi:MAG: hypothetical protein OD918_03885, partial [Gammaproteobacteria bacterium]